MDFDLMSEEISAVPKQPTHHKKQSTFANVPFADTHGLDDFYGFSAEETNQALEVKELKEILQQNKETIANKDEIIHTLRQENESLKHTVTDLTLKLQQSQGLKARNSTHKSPTPEANITETDSSDPLDIFKNILPHNDNEETVAVGHAISESLDNFLDNLDFKFKEDEGDDTKETLPPLKTEEDKDADHYIYNPSAVLDIDGHLPPLRRSSLSEDEQQQMEMEVAKEIQRRTESMAHEELNTVSNIIFNDTNVNNMNMNITNHHNHTHNESNTKNETEIVSNTEYLEKQIQSLQNEMQQMKLAKIQLVIRTANEIDALRCIIRQHIIK